MSKNSTVEQKKQNYSKIFHWKEVHKSFEKMDSCGRMELEVFQFFQYEIFFFFFFYKTKLIVQNIFWKWNKSKNDDLENWKNGTQKRKTEWDYETHKKCMKK